MYSNTSRLIGLVCTALLMTFSGSAQAVLLQSLSIDTASGPRQYILATPTLPADTPRPLVLLFHGHTGTAANALGQGRWPSPLTAWLNIVDREKIVVAALQGLKGSDNQPGWHDCRLDDSVNTSADDLGFTEELVTNLIQTGRADSHRIYVMGMSNGGMMAFRLALEMHPVPVAVSAVSASMARQTACTGLAPKVSILLINGTADPIVPYGGGQVGLSGNKKNGEGTVIGAKDSRDFWLHADGLSDEPPVAHTIPHVSYTDPTLAIRYSYGQDGGPQVETITIHDGGHVEPSLVYHYGLLWRMLVGKQNKDFESAEEAWRFFRDKRSN